MVPEPVHEFFAAASAVAGALIGLLFVALSVWREREQTPALREAHQLRAVAALTTFTNALVVSLLGLVPDDNLGQTTTIIAIVGLVYVTASLIRLRRLYRDGVRVRARDLIFLAGGVVLFAAQLWAGAVLWAHPGREAVVENICDLVVFALLFGIARSWELIGGPRVGVVSEVRDIIGSTSREPSPDDGPDSPTPDAPGEA